MIDQRIHQDCDYILLVEKEKIARLDNEISEGAELCVQIVNFNLIILIIIIIFFTLNLFYHNSG
jgi:hypothetical protein